MPLSPYAHAHRAIRLFPSLALQRLVRQHAQACAATGLDVDAIEGKDDVLVHRWLHDRVGILPAGLAEDLERIDQLADDRGAATLLEVGATTGTETRGLGLDPLEVAVRTFLDHPALFERAHGRRLVETLRGTTEFIGRTPGTAGLLDLVAIQALEARLGRQFEARARSAHCRVTVGRDGDRLVFTIAHGALVRADEALDSGPMMVRECEGPVYLAESSLRYRPQRRDVVVYDATAGRLRIRAGDAPTLHAYRRGFGELLFGDGDWFGDDAIVSLEPLVRLGAAIEAPTPGLREVRLVGLILRHAAPVGKMALDSDEIWPYLQSRLVGGLDDAELIEASFRVFPIGSGGVATIKIRTPNRVEYGRMADELFRPFLEARGLLARACTRTAG